MSSTAQASAGIEGMPADPKNARRVRDPDALRRKLLAERECRIDDCGRQATDPHHIVYKSLQGEDAEDNIVGLCREHHSVIHDGNGPAYWEARYAIGEALTDNEILYALIRLGDAQGSEFLSRAYGVSPDRIDGLRR